MQTVENIPGRKRERELEHAHVNKRLHYALGCITELQTLLPPWQGGGEVQNDVTNMEPRVMRMETVLYWESAGNGGVHE